MEVQRYSVPDVIIHLNYAIKELLSGTDVCHLSVQLMRPGIGRNVSCAVGDFT